MAVRPIAIIPDPILKRKAKEVEIFDDSLARLVADMGDTMYGSPHQGVGLAAPQIFEGLRVVVYDIDWLDKDNPRRNLRVIVNPRIVVAEGEQVFTEGCLSIPGFYEEVKRFHRVVVEAFDLSGVPFTIDASGYHAVVLQHEIDHLDGILFIDRLSLVKRRLYRAKLLKGKVP